MKIEIDFPFHGYTKGDLIEFCFGKNANVDPAIPHDLYWKIADFFDNSDKPLWYVMDYTDNLVGGQLVNLKEKFFSRVAALYLQQMPKTMAERNAKQMKCFRFDLVHDKGEKPITVIAQNEEIAKMMLMESEGCPERAIKRRA